MNGAVVTGGANGIGKAVVGRLRKGGYRVAVLDIEPGPTNDTAGVEHGENAGARYFACDVTNDQQVSQAMARAVEWLGPVGAIVHCAGKNTYGDPLDTTTDEFDAAIDINLRAAWLVAKRGIPHMSATGGSVVLIASIHSYQTRTQRFPYPVAKAGILGLTRSLALDLGPRNVRVNAVCPGIIRTRLLDSTLGPGPDAAAKLAKLEETHPLGRIGEPDDIAGVVHFLTTEEAAFITGTSIVVDGGLTAGLPG